MLLSAEERRAAIEDTGGEWIHIEDVPVMALFEDPSLPAQPGETPVNVQAPVITCVSEDVATIVSGASVRRGDVLYRTLSNEPNGHGLSILPLEIAT